MIRVKFGGTPTWLDVAKSRMCQIPGLLAEFGLIVPQGIGRITGKVQALIEDASNEVSG